MASTASPVGVRSCDISSLSGLEPASIIADFIWSRFGVDAVLPSFVSDASTFLASSWAGVKGTGVVEALVVTVIVGTALESSLPEKREQPDRAKTPASPRAVVIA